MNLQHDGLTLWYGTPDTPCPFEGEVVPRSGVSLVIGAHPATPTNSLVVWFRRDGGFWEMAPGREVRVDYARSYQYFAVVFPRFVTGDRIDYTPVLTCSGRQVPVQHLIERHRRHFLLEARDAARSKRSRS